MINLKKLLLEKSIGKVSRKINVTIELDKTRHAGERQFRHDTEIQDKEILAVAQRSIEPLTRELLGDDIRVGDVILIRDSRTKLNLVGKLKEKGDTLELVIITVMRKAGFKPKSGTKVLDI